MKEKYTEKEFYDEIIRIHDEFNFINTTTLKNNCKLDIDVTHYLHKFGGIKNICNKLGLNYIHALRSNKEDIRNDFYKVYKDHGYINKETYLKFGNFSWQSVMTAYGGINNLMEEFGIPLNMNRMVSEDVVLSDINKICKKYKTTSTSVYRKYGLYSESVILRLFGTWENAVLKSGIEYKKRKFGKKEIERQVRDVFDKYGFISKVLINDECDFTYQALKPYYKNKNEISKMLGVKNAFCDKLSSKAEVLYKILIKIYPDTIKEKTWKWLINDKTKHPLWVDFYIPSVNTAIEFDGKQHYHFVKRFHKTYDEFLESKYRDHIKEQLLGGHGIRLIRISYEERISESLIIDLISKSS